MSVVLDNLPLYFEGLRTTVLLTLCAFAAAMAIGTVVASFRVSPVPPLRGTGGLYVELVRNTPLTVLLVLFYFGFTKIGIQYPPFASAVIVSGVYTSAFVAETVRSGVNAVSRGQAEAARSLGLTFPQVLATIVLPQAFRTVVAPLGNLFIALTKNTSIMSLIVLDLAEAADIVSNRSGRPIPAFLGAAFGYLLLTFPSGFAVGAIERRVAIKR